MSNGRLWSSGSRKLAVLLLAVVLPPAVTLAWLGLQLLEQDRSLLAQRDIERRQAAAQATRYGRPTASAGLSTRVQGLPDCGKKLVAGRRLFFDRRLSRNGTIACATCHDPLRAFATLEPSYAGR